MTARKVRQNRRIDAPGVIRRTGTQEVKLPADVRALHIAVGEIRGKKETLIFTDAGLYALRCGRAEKVEAEIGELVAVTQETMDATTPQCRSTDRDWRRVAAFAVVVAVVVALLATFW